MVVERENKQAVGRSRFGSRVRLGANNVTEEEFDQFLAKLDRDRDIAAGKYQTLRRKLVELFEHRACRAAEDLADETIDRIARKLKTEEIRNIHLFAHGVALKVYLEIRKDTARFSGFEDGADSELVGESDPEARIVEKMGNAQEMECLRRCLGKLPLEDRDLILQYYEGEKQVRILNRQELAKRLGVNIEALRNEANALRDKLRNCLTRCLATARWRGSSSYLPGR